MNLNAWMVKHERTPRYRPTELPVAEKYTVIGRMVDALWFLAEEMNVDIGRKPTLLYNQQLQFAPPRILEALTTLELELHSTTSQHGLSAALVDALNRETALRPVNFKKIIDDTYEEEETSTAVD